MLRVRAGKLEFDMWRASSSKLRQKWSKQRVKAAALQGIAGENKARQRLSELHKQGMRSGSYCLTPNMECAQLAGN